MHLLFKHILHILSFLNHTVKISSHGQDFNPYHQFTVEYWKRFNYELFKLTKYVHHIHIISSITLTEISQNSFRLKYFSSHKISISTMHCVIFLAKNIQVCKQNVVKTRVPAIKKEEDFSKTARSLTWDLIPLSSTWASNGSC